MNTNLYNALKKLDHIALKDHGFNVHLCKCLDLHWSGKYEQSIAEYNLIDFSDLSEFEVSVAQADKNLLLAKIGKPIGECTKQIENFKISKAIHLYAKFSSWFWKDHKIANQALTQLFFLSIRMFWVDLMLMSLFLMGHMLTIKGHRYLGYYLALFAFKYMNKQKEFTSKVVLAGFPYTHVVSGRIGKKFEKSAHIGNKYLDSEPYYRAVYTVSCLYGYAYNGNYNKAESLAFELSSFHEDNNTLRYKPISEIMPLLPLATKGYAASIESEFDTFMQNFDDSAHSNLICSQFYRVATIITLNLHRFDEAKSYYSKTVDYRIKTNSFHAWKKFDDKLEKAIQLKKPFTSNDQASFSGSLINHIVCIFGKLARLENTEAELFIAKAIGSHLSIKLLPESINKISTKQCQSTIKIGDHSYSFTVSKEQKIYIDKQLSSLETILKVLFVNRAKEQKQLAFSNLKKAKEKARIRFHDIKASLSPVAILHEHFEPKMSRILLNVVENVHQYCHDYADDFNSVCQKESFVIGDLINEIKADFSDLNSFKNIDLNITVINVENKPISSQLDFFDFKMILKNLILNSIEASEVNQSVYVSLSIQGDFLTILVTDQGIGIKEYQINDITQLGVTFNKPSGTGIGLHHVSKCVKAAGGALNIKSKYNHGTTVSLCIPINTADERSSYEESKA